MAAFLRCEVPSTVAEWEFSMFEPISSARKTSSTSNHLATKGLEKLEQENKIFQQKYIKDMCVNLVVRRFTQEPERKNGRMKAEKKKQKRNREKEEDLEERRRKEKARLNFISDESILYNPSTIYNTCILL